MKKVSCDNAMLGCVFWQPIFFCISKTFFQCKMCNCGVLLNCFHIGKCVFEIFGAKLQRNCINPSNFTTKQQNSVIALAIVLTDYYITIFCTWVKKSFQVIKLTANPVYCCCLAFCFQTYIAESKDASTDASVKMHLARCFSPGCIQLDASLVRRI